MLRCDHQPITSHWNEIENPCRLIFLTQLTFLKSSIARASGTPQTSTETFSTRCWLDIYFFSLQFPTLYRIPRISFRGHRDVDLESVQQWRNKFYNLSSLLLAKVKCLCDFSRRPFFASIIPLSSGMCLCSFHVGLLLLHFLVVPLWKTKLTASWGRSRTEQRTCYSFYSNWLKRIREFFHEQILSPSKNVPNVCCVVCLPFADAFSRFRFFPPFSLFSHFHFLLSSFSLSLSPISRLFVVKCLALEIPARNVERVCWQTFRVNFCHFSIAICSH